MDVGKVTYSFLLGLITSITIYSGDLQGIVKNSKGNPVINAIVAVTPEAPNSLSDAEHVAKVVRTNTNGSFLIRELPGGSYGATATSIGNGSCFLGKLKIPEKGVLGEISFVLGDDGTTVDGQIRISNGSTLKDIQVYAVRESNEAGDIFCADVKENSYKLSLSPGKYTFHISAPGWEGSSENIKLPNSSTRLNLSIWPEKGVMPGLASELLTMARIDQEIRNRGSEDLGNITFKEEMLANDRKNETRMKEIVRGHGWPDANLVGLKAAGAAWVLVQHSSAPFLKECLPSMKKAAERGDLSWGMVALSIDRDLKSDGKKQLYGSQFRKNDRGEWEPYPIEDEAHVDERRAKVGLVSLAEYKAGFLQAYSSKP